MLFSRWCCSLGAIRYGGIDDAEDEHYQRK